MPRYRVGDFVELVVDAPDDNLKLSPGDIGQIVKISGGNLGVDWGKTVDTTGIFGGYTLWTVSEGLIEPALETAMPELDPAFTDLL